MKKASIFSKIPKPARTANAENLEKPDKDVKIKKAGKNIKLPKIKLPNIKLPKIKLPNAVNPAKSTKKQVFEPLCLPDFYSLYS